MRAGLLIFAMSCGGGDDECSQLKRKLRPVIEEMLVEAGREMPEADLAETLTAACAEPKSEPQRRFRTCLLAAPDQPSAKNCFKTQLEEFQKGPPDRPAPAPSDK